MFACVHHDLADAEAFAPAGDPRWTSDAPLEATLVRQRRAAAAARRAAELRAQQDEVRSSQEAKDQMDAFHGLALQVPERVRAQAARDLLRSSEPAQVHTYYMVTFVADDEQLRRLLLDYFAAFCAQSVRGAHEFLQQRLARMRDGRLSIEWGWIFATEACARAFVRGSGAGDLVHSVVYKPWNGVRLNAAHMPRAITEPLLQCKDLLDDAVVAFIWHKHYRDRVWQTPMHWVDVRGAKTQEREQTVFDDALARMSVRNAFCVRRITCTGASLHIHG